MSAFLVEKETIDRIVTLIDYEHRKSVYFKSELEKELKINFLDVDWKSRRGQKMWELNQLALGYRYGDNEVNLHYVYSDASWSLSHIQMFKSLKCWLYQCCEGGVFRSEDYKVFREKSLGLLALGLSKGAPSMKRRNGHERGDSVMINRTEMMG